jgi:NAD(P)-dependent dehydrogenase (short-subunit alcohol dehydrogenase family)
MSPKVAIITGAASGIGKHFAHSLIANDDDYCVVLADINEACLKAIGYKLRISGNGQGP